MVPKLVTRLLRTSTSGVVIFLTTPIKEQKLYWATLHQTRLGQRGARNSSTQLQKLSNKHIHKYLHDIYQRITSDINVQSQLTGTGLKNNALHYL
jgi:hypothetical protein